MKAAAVLIIAGFFALFGCSEHSPRKASIGVAETGSMPEKMQWLYPERFTMYHHVILTVRGKNYDFNGHLTRDGNQLTAVAFNDLGGQLFHFKTSVTKVDILTKPPHMPSGVLQNYVAQELRAMVGASGFQEARGSENHIVLTEGRRSIEYVFASEHCESIFIRENQKNISTIQLSDYRKYDGWEHDIPQSMTISNSKWDYEMIVRLLQIKFSS